MRLALALWFLLLPPLSFSQELSYPTLKSLQTIDIGPWESGDAISDIYMAIEPGKFAMKSHLHLTGMSDPTAFVDILLSSTWFYVYVP